MTVTNEKLSIKVTSIYSSRPMNLYDYGAVGLYTASNLVAVVVSAMNDMACNGSTITGGGIGLAGEMILMCAGVGAAQLGQEVRKDMMPERRTVKKPVRYAMIASGLVLAANLGYMAHNPSQHACDSLLSPDIKRSLQSLWPKFKPATLSS